MRLEKLMIPNGRIRTVTLLIGLLILLLALAACGGDEPESKTVAQVEVAAPTDIPAPTDTPTTVPTATPTDTPVPTDTPSPEPTATPTASPTPLPTDTPSPEPAGDRPAASPDLVYMGNPSAPDGRPQVNISFDVQGDPQMLYKVLDILDEFDYRTTFFLQGEWVSWYPEATQKIAARGHELANHSWTHAAFNSLGAEEVTKELEDTEELVMELTGQTTRPFFRPPYGSRSELSVKTAYDLGWTTVIWTYGADEWRDGATAQTIYDNVYGNAAPGALYYTHSDRQIILDALPRVLQSFQDAGYALVSLGEILADSSEGEAM
ncbi:MAG: polysaccharide deacetylase family protein [Chloroflexota bacterium]|nr:polysaccharide deacetylase family protein [Chloroflexota bacterium]